MKSPAVSFLVFLLSGEWHHFLTLSNARAFVEQRQQDAELYDTGGGFLGLFLHRQGWVA